MRLALVPYVVLAGAFFALPYVRANPGVENCRLPPKLPAIDWKKLSGNWYMTIRTVYAVSPERVTCAVFSGFVETEDGASFLTEAYKIGTNKTVYTSHIIRKRNGVYMDDKIDLVSFILAEDVDENGKFDEKDFERDLNGVISNGFATITNYENYLCFTVCSSTGDWRVWCYTKSPVPKIGDVLAAINSLHEYEIHVKFFLSECDEKNLEQEA